MELSHNTDFLEKGDKPFYEIIFLREMKLPKAQHLKSKKSKITHYLPLQFSMEVLTILLPGEVMEAQEVLSLHQVL